MVLTLIISMLTIFALILFVIYKPVVNIKKIRVESFWIIALIGAFLLILFGLITPKEIYVDLTNNEGMNPIKLLVIFLSMSGLSIILDVLGFFKVISNYVLKKAGDSQIKIFMYLYITVSILTIFTSNDIIVLTFTPIICYFAKHAKINPLPLLITEFVAANTWSLMLMIGNPTNIYLASQFNISFTEYLNVMFIPTLITGLFTFLLLFIIFRKSLLKKIEHQNIEDVYFHHKFLVISTLTHLILCTILLTISSYINIEMYLICLMFFLSAVIFIFVYQKVRKLKDSVLSLTFKRIPWNLMPFVISMFILVMGLNKSNITEQISVYLNFLDPLYGYGLSSFFASNLVNNIPMSVLFSEILKYISISDFNYLNKAIYSSIIGSNIGAYLTPIGALAGLMWMRQLKQEGIELSFLRFIKYGLIIAIPTILVALISLSFVL
ncbi:SLC13 family permease [Acholeplasma granularum]|uniref:SLC13 family permease n=1 Tax=Acholeplasma granularum TaxID=264635 RepID=UPI00046F21C7|nr:SLC13 family permease [Acholeplasma granularum]